MPSESLFRYFFKKNSPYYALLFFGFASLYVFLAWLICGGETWWVIDFVDAQNVFFGDDAYRFFLSKSAWVNPDLYTYNFVLPGQLFLDGAITFIVQGDLFLSRCFHALVGAGALCLVLANGIRLGIPRKIMFFAVLAMGLLPRYALMSLSFYGEVWLGFFVCLSLFLYLRKQFLLMALAASWMPLLRPEGIFFLAPLCLSMVLARRWKELVLLLLPGALYFIYLNLALASLTDYYYWRIELRHILKKIIHPVGKWDLINIYSFFFTVPAVIGAFLLNSRRMWPFLLGGGAWLCFLQIEIILGLATFENRYSYVLIPILTILWANFYSWILLKLSDVLLGRAALLRGAVVPISALFLIASNLSNTDNVRRVLLVEGFPALVKKIWHGRWDEIYGYYPKESLRAWKWMNQKMEQVLAEDPGIDKLAIFDSFLYYNLDPYAIPKGVTVEFLTNSYMVFHILLDGQAFTQHTGGKMYSYLNYGKPNFSSGERRILVAAHMPLAGYPYTWKRDKYEMYLFSYQESTEPQVDISSRPDITPKLLKEAYSAW